MIKDWYSEDHLRFLVLEELLKAIQNRRSITIVGNTSKLSSEIDEVCHFYSGLSPKMNDRSFVHSTEWSRKFVEMDMILQRLIVSSRKIHGQVFGQVNVLELVEITADAKKKKSENLLKGLIDKNLFEFTKQEFWAIRGKLVKAMDLFSEELIFMDNHSPLNDSIYIVQEENSRAVVNKYLDNFMGKSHGLIQDYAHFFSAFKDEILQDREAQLNDINEKLYTLVQEYKRFGTLPVQDEIQALNNRIAKLLNIEDFSQSYITESNLSDRVFQSIHRALKNGQIYLEKKRKTINVRNYRNVRLVELEQRFEEFLKELNGSEILTDRLENNSISSWLKFQQLQQVHNVLASTKSLLQQGNPYFQWKAFLEDCDMQMQHLLGQLVKFPKMDWLPMVESWYLSETLIDLDFNRQSKMAEEVNTFCDLYNDQYMDFHAVMVTIVKTFANEEKPIVKYIDAAEKFDLMESVKNEMSEELILILPQEDILIDNAVSSLDSTSIISFNPKANRNFSEAYINRYDYVQSELISAELNDKLQWSKFLAHSLKDFVADLKFLFTPTKNIITHSKSFVSDEIIQILQDGNIKQIHIADNPEQNITEYFLNDSEKAYFIYDQSIFRFATSHDVIQFGALLKSLQTAGYHTIYLDNTRFDDEAYVTELKENTAQITSYA